MLNKEEELLEYIKEAKRQIQDNGRFHSAAEQEALLDMVKQAQKALSGLNQAPHSGSRGFIEKQDKEAQIAYALEHYTMAPTYLDGKKPWSTYGLKEALSWYKEQASTAEQVERKNNAFQKRAEQLQRTANGGNTMLFIDQEELDDLKNKCRTNAGVREQYLQIKKIADEIDLQEIRKRYELLFQENDYNMLNRDYYLWTRTASNVNFEVPEEAAYATLQFILPAEENEKEGLGHVWIDNVTIEASSCEFTGLKNGGFEQKDEQKTNTPKHWKSSCISGKPKLLWEDQKPYAGDQTHSIYLENPDSASAGMWQYEEKLLFTPGEMYTLQFSAKIDGKMKKGVCAEIDFYDQEHTKIHSFCHFYNRKAWIPCGDYNLRMQCDAICYAVSSDKTYAYKAKYEILHFMDDFIQGAEYWLRKNSRPEGSDAYGAVQGGRDLCSIASAYALIREADVFCEEEKKCFFDMIDYMLRYMLDKRDRSTLTLEQAQHGCSNWQLDMCIGAVMIMLAVTDYPDREIWIMNGYQVVKAQLVCNLNKDGSWPESIRYHHAALERLASFAYVLKKETGENWFEDQRLQGMFRYSLLMQTPGYIYFDGNIATPPFGDHALSDGREYACHGRYCKEIAKVDKELADQMYETWCRAGKPVKKLWGEAVALENLLYCYDDYKVKPSFQLKLTSEDRFRDAGIYIFRGEEQSGAYCAVMASERPIGHGHLDQGAFVIYKDHIPVVMDSGIEGYFNSSTQWHISSYSHAVMQFAAGKFAKTQTEEAVNLSAGTYSRKRGWYDVPRCSHVLECVMNEQDEYIRMEIMNTGGKGKDTRTIYHHKASDIYVIQDQVSDFEGDVLFNLPTVMKHNVIEENNVTGEGYYQMNLQTVFLGKVKKLWQEQGRSTEFFPHTGDVSMLSYIRAVSDAKDGFCVVIQAGQEKQIQRAEKLERGIRIWTSDQKVLEIAEEVL